MLVVCLFVATGTKPIPWASNSKGEMEDWGGGGES